tara:strand:- start:162 stop:890 length:729 start_codon:yes stop_codon:yes gene_type:complete
MHIRKFANERVEFGNLDLEVQIERTNRKRTISLQVKDNKLIVKAPRTASRQSLDDLIQRKQSWIKKRAILNVEERKLRNRKFIDNEKFYFKGNEYRLSLIFGGKEEVKISEGFLIVTCKDDRAMGSKEVKTFIEDWYVRESTKILNTRTYEFAKKMKVEPSAITVKNYASKWGSCTASNKISYNWRIIMAPDCIVDYLIIHELCHIIEHNHSKNFWYQVGKYCEDFKKKRKWLRENGHKLVL